ncbi:hypothetical protein ACM55H_15785 [Flavobacterium sp. ZT3R17]|uniref:hypothetical protein n=1 Tax=Flavobacterium cryoconiti TaxID=3398736 RepID=UPI003A85D0AD
MKSKKTEINHSLFQQKRLESVNYFFSNYATTQQMWKDIPIYDILERKMTSKEIDKYIFPHLNELRRNVFELKIYFKESEHKSFQTILENMHLINATLSSEYFYFKEDRDVITKSNNFQSFRDNKLKENELINNKIASKLQQMFN